MELETFRKPLFITVIAVITLLTIVSAAQSVTAFRIGKYDFGPGGISRHDPGQDQQADIPPVVSDQQIVEGIRDVNSNRQASTFMKSAFADQNFCVQTENRHAYLAVDSAGRLELMPAQPRQCYVITTTEEALAKSWHEYENGLPMRYSDVRDRFDIPFRVRARIALARTFG